MSQVSTAQGVVSTLTMPSGGPYIYWPTGQSAPYTFTLRGDGGQCTWEVEPVPAAQGQGPLQVTVRPVTTNDYSGDGTMTIYFDVPGWNPVGLPVVFYPSATPPP